MGAHAWNNKSDTQLQRTNLTTIVPGVNNEQLTLLRLRVLGLPYPQVFILWNKIRLFLQGTCMKGRSFLLHSLGILLNSNRHSRPSAGSADLCGEPNSVLGLPPKCQKNYSRRTTLCRNCHEEKLCRTSLVTSDHFSVVIALFQCLKFPSVLGKFTATQQN